MRLRHGWSVRARRRAAGALDACLQPLGLEVTPEASLTEAQRRVRGRGTTTRASTRATAASRPPTSPRLLELSRRYRTAGPVGAGGGRALWRPGYIRPADLLFFRCRNPYIYQDRVDAGQHQLLAWLHLTGPITPVCRNGRGPLELVGMPTYRFSPRSGLSFAPYEPAFGEREQDR
jgi:hypothetical protein